MLKKELSLIMIFILLSTISCYADSYRDPNNLYKEPVVGISDIPADIDIGTLRVCFPDEFFKSNIQLINDVLSGKYEALYDPNSKESRAFIQNAYYLLPLQLDVYMYTFYTLAVKNQILYNVYQKLNNTHALHDLYKMQVCTPRYTMWLYDIGHINRSIILNYNYEIYPFAY